MGFISSPGQFGHMLKKNHQFTNDKLHTHQQAQSSSVLVWTAKGASRNSHILTVLLWHSGSLSGSQTLGRGGTHYIQEVVRWVDHTFCYIQSAVWHIWQSGVQTLSSFPRSGQISIRHAGLLGQFATSPGCHLHILFSHPICYRLLRTSVVGSSVPLALQTKVLNLPHGVPPSPETASSHCARICLSR